MPATEARAEARRAMDICNACRYCEGYCAVFPAMELRRAFSDADLSYLANLCHDCRACFHACQYAPPHEFGVNLPKAFAELRAETYAEFAWPRAMAALFRRNGALVSVIASVALALALLLTVLLQSPGVLYNVHRGAGAFYRVIPLGAMVAVGMLTFAYALLALGMGVARFWRDAGGEGVGLRALARALADAATLRNLGGGGDGCNDLDDRFSNARRWLHHAMAYGFALCFAATSVAFVYHEFLGRVAPYAVASAPVLLGTAGGIGLLIGTSGLLAMKAIADPMPAAGSLLGMDSALLLLLALVSASGLMLLALRETGAMGVLLAAHLGFVLALFLVLPYGKFVHAAYRFAALLRYAIER